MMTVGKKKLIFYGKTKKLNSFLCPVASSLITLCTVYSQYASTKSPPLAEILAQP